MKCKQQQQQHIELPFEVQGIACDVQKQGDSQYTPLQAILTHSTYLCRTVQYDDSVEL